MCTAFWYLPGFSWRIASKVAWREVSMMCSPSRSRLAMPNSSDEAPAAFVVAGRQRIDIALDLQRFADIGADDAHQVFVHPPFARQRHQGDREALLEDLA